MLNQTLNERYSNLNLIKLIKEQEATFPVETWEIDGIKIWPIIRNNFPYLFSKFRVKNNVIHSKSDHIKAKKLKFFYDVFTNFFVSLKIFWQLWKNRRKCQTLLVSDGVSKTKLDDEWIDKFCDPLINDNKISALCLEQVTSINRNYRRSYISLESFENISYFIARILFLFLKPKLILKNYQNFLKSINHYNLDKYLTESEIIILIYKIKICAWLFSKILKWYEIKESYIVCYYGTLGYALSLACHSNNINCTDIEHGSIINCPAYWGWSKVPETGYDVIPHRFSIWHSVLKTLATDNNVNYFNDQHYFSVDGLMIKNYLEKNQDKVVKETAKITKMLISYRKIILVTLQPQFYGLNDWEKLSSVIVEGSNDWGWIIRLHPAYKDLSGMGSILSIKASNVIFDKSEYNLYLLLEKIDCHVTTASATALEAMIYKKPTLFISKVALEDFNFLIESKYAIYAENEQSIMSNLKILLSEDKHEKYRSCQ